MKRIFCFSLALAIMLLAGCKKMDGQIKIAIPPNTLGEFSFSDEEIEGKGIILSSGDYLPDTLIMIKDSQGNESAPTYITSGQKIHLQTENGVYYKIGVLLDNKQDEYKLVYVSYENANSIRIQ